MNAENITKLIEVTAKYAWSLFVAIGFVLFLPHDLAVEMGLTSIRSSHLGYLWIGFILSAALWLSSALPKIWKFASASREEARKTNQEEQRRQRVLEKLRTRLHSLSADEIEWMQYCLFFNQQTVYAPHGQRTAQALMQKELCSSGGGQVFSLPYSLTDNTWKLVKDMRGEFLPAELEADKKFIAHITTFQKRLHPTW